MYNALEFLTLVAVVGHSLAQKVEEKRIRSALAAASQGTSEVLVGQWQIGNPKSGCEPLRSRAGRASGMPRLLLSSARASQRLKASAKHLLLKHPFAVLFVQYILHFISSDKLICFVLQLKGSCSVNKKKL